MSDKVTIFEVGPRDGLQNEQEIIATERKIALVDALSDAGLRKIEVSSFVSPKWIPQLADASEVFAGIKRREGVSYAALVPNLRGCEAAIAAGASEVAVFASASETFSKKNINCSIADSLARFAPVFELAGANDLPVRGYLSCVTDCPYEGPIAPEAVARLAEVLIDAGCYEVSLGDTIGKGTTASVKEMLAAVLRMVPADRLAGHFHDTQGRALDNIRVCLEAGIRCFDSSIGGLGGCPYAVGAPGNVATEKLVDMLTSQGMGTSVDRAKLERLAASVGQGRRG